MTSERCKVCGKVSAVINHVCRECWIDAEVLADTDYRYSVIRRFALDDIARLRNVQTVLARMVAHG